MPGNDLLEIAIPLNEAFVEIHKIFKIRNLYLMDGYLNRDYTLIFGFSINLFDDSFKLFSFVILFLLTKLFENYKFI